MLLQQLKNNKCVVLLCVVFLTEYVHCCDDTCQKALLQGFDEILQQKLVTLQAKIDDVDGIFGYFQQKIGDMEEKVLDIHVNMQAVNGRSSESLVNTQNVKKMQTQIIEGIRNITEKLETVDEGIINISENTKTLYDDLEEIKNTTVTIQNVSSTLHLQNNAIQTKMNETETNIVMLLNTIKNDTLVLEDNMKQDIEIQGNTIVTNIEDSLKSRHIEIMNKFNDNTETLKEGISNITENTNTLYDDLEDIKNTTVTIQNVSSTLHLQNKAIQTKMNETEKNIVMLLSTIKNDTSILENNMKQDIELQGNTIVTNIEDSLKSKHSEIMNKVNENGAGIKSQAKSTIKEVQDTRKEIRSKLETIHSDMLCPPPFKKLTATGECFYVSNDPLSWDSARSRCHGLGADLAVPSDFEALQRHLSIIPKGQSAAYYYLGGNDRASPKKQISWITGEAVTGPWLSTEPQFAQDENCIILYATDGVLGDASKGCGSSSTYGYICQKRFIY